MDPEMPLPTSFADARYFPQSHLMTWHPCGPLDEQLSDRMVEFLEWEETALPEPFHRFADLSGITEVHLMVGHAFELARRRREGYRGPRVKSAIFSDKFVTYGVARMYETLMDGALIVVQTYRTRESAVEWLGVPVEKLLPPEAP